MSLSERVRKPVPAGKNGTPCSIGEVYRLLSEDQHELAALELLLYGTSGRGRTAPAVVEILAAEGFSVALQTVNRHRGGRCRCFKPTVTDPA